MFVCGGGWGDKVWNTAISLLSEQGAEVKDRERETRLHKSSLQGQKVFMFSLAYL